MCIAHKNRISNEAERRRVSENIEAKRRKKRALRAYLLRASDAMASHPIYVLAYCTATAIPICIF
jgi:hypothetical protein